MVPTGISGAVCVIPGLGKTISHRRASVHGRNVAALWLLGVDAGSVHEGLGVSGVGHPFSGVWLVPTADPGPLERTLARSDVYRCGISVFRDSGLASPGNGKAE